MANHHLRVAMWLCAAATMAYVSSAGCASRSSSTTTAAAVRTTRAVTQPPTDPVAAERDRMVREVLSGIAGRESEPAGRVFENIRSLNAVPARQLLAIMSQGYARSLGVGCAHCHVVGRWASDDKVEKQIARDMIQMASTINTQLLANIKNLKGPQPIVNCTTCHRGQVKPALNLS